MFASNHGSEPTGGVTEAARAIVAAIRAGGPLTFRDFMERALYDPRHGYYTAGGSPWGLGGDYLTAPQVGPMLGDAIAGLAAESDAALGEPNPFTLVEAGSGDGTLLLDVAEALRRSHVDVYRRLRLASVERSERWREHQRRRSGSHSERIRWLGSISELESDAITGLVVANELIDALPVHRVVREGSALRELYIDVEDDRLVQRAGPLSTPRLRQYLDDNAIRLVERQVADVCLAAGDWIRDVAVALARGWVLIIDYGAETRALFGPDRIDGTLACQRGFELSADPLQHVGEQDITAHVDFGNLVRAGRSRGLEPVGRTGLGAFLLGFVDIRATAGEGLGSVRYQLGLRHLLFSEISVAHSALLLVKGLDPGTVPFGQERLAGDSEAAEEP